jgi:stage II sporulation protein AA (anti-sigma F factor antagonist)
MQLSLQPQFCGDVMVIRCSGRIVTGEEAQSLQRECDKHTLETKKFVLQLQEVNFLDSGGLGTLVRLLGSLRAHRGDLKLCQLSPFLLKVFATTNLAAIFHTYASEKEAIEAFSHRQQQPPGSPHPSKPKILCVEDSADLLAYLSALLKQSGYEVFTTKNLGDAATFMRATKPAMVVCGPAVQANRSLLDKFRGAHSNVELFLLPPDFVATDASEASLALVSQIQTLVNPAR